MSPKDKIINEDIKRMKKLKLVLFEAFHEFYRLILLPEKTNNKKCRYLTYNMETFFRREALIRNIKVPAIKNSTRIIKTCLRFIPFVVKENELAEAKHIYKQTNNKCLIDENNKLYITILQVIKEYMTQNKFAEPLDDYVIIKCVKKSLYDKKNNGNLAASFGFNVIDEEGYSIIDKKRLKNDFMSLEWKQNPSFFDKTTYSYKANYAIIEELQKSYDAVVEHNRRHR
ncbi:hypothetical protein WA158_002129 [Blastocystis sp. Blastoise]